MWKHAVTACLFVAILLVACGGHSSRQVRVLPGGSSPDAYQLALDSLPPDLGAEVDALVPPPGCDEALFYKLKKSFVQALALRLNSGDKLVAVAPGGDGNIVRGLTTQQSGADFILHWNYHNTGDYDQNGAVGITDITPIAMHYGKNQGNDPLAIVVDGDGGGTVGISDITPLAMNFGINLDHYRVETATAEAGPWSELGQVLLSTGINGDIGWRQLQFTLPNADPRWLRVVPVDGQGSDGIPSDMLNFLGTAPPDIISVSPTSGVVNAPVTFTAVINGNGPFTYAWDFAGAASPSTSGFSQPAVTLAGSSGDYNCSLTVTNSAGEDTFNFVVTIGSPPDVSAVSPATGVSGDSVQFIATVAGDAPLSYAWDFDGGATPDTSTEENPTVTLGAEGTYNNASVTVTNPYGEDFLGFSYYVAPPNMPPNITSVSPTGGATGSQITISAFIAGTPPFSYSWSFSEGATPDTSTDATPVITLGAEGTYACTLDVTNSFGNDTYNFNLNVGPIGDPPDITNAGPTQGHTGDAVTFTATVTGDPPFNYAWDFGSASTPSTSADPAPLETLTNSTGTYPVSLVVTNIAGQDTYNFNIDISPSSDYDEVEPNNPLPDYYNALPPFPISGWHCRLTETDDEDDYFSFSATVGDHVDITMNMDSDDPDLDMALEDSQENALKSSTGTSIQEHIVYDIAMTGTYYVHCYYFGYDTLNAGDYTLDITSTPNSMDEVENNDTLGEANALYFPLVDFFGSIGAGGYDGDDDDYFTFNAASGDFLNFNLAQSGTTYNIDYDLLDVNGAVLKSATGTGQNDPMTYTFAPTDQGPFYIHAKKTTNGGLYILSGTVGLSPFWQTNVIDNLTSTDLGYYSSLVVTTGNPGAFYKDQTNNDVCYAYSADSDGMGLWTAYSIDTTDSVGTWLSGGSVGGYPAAAYTDSTNTSIKFAMCSTADGSGTWYISEVDPDGIDDPSVALVNGYPALAYRHDGVDADEPYFAINSQVDGSGTWALYPVDSNPGGCYYTCLITLADGKPGISYYANSAGGVRFASCDAIGGNGTWTVTEVDSGGSSQTGAALVEGKPAVVYSNSGNPFYAINSNAQGTGTWSTKQITNTGTSGYKTLRVFGGMPVVAYMGSDSHVHYAVSTTADGLTSWTQTQIVLYARVGSCHALEFVNGKPAIVLQDSTDDWVGFATPAIWP